MKTLHQIVATVATCTLVTAAFAAEPPKEMSAEEQAMMAKMQKFGSPNENHKVLEVLAGSWTYTGKFWMDSSKPPDAMIGTSENTMVYGGRFLKQAITADWHGQPFEGMSLTGYDNVREEYVSIWMDNMMTGIMSGSGKYDALTKTLTTESTYSCPMTGEKERWSRSETVFTGMDQYSYFSFSRDAAGKEFKSMEIVYTRKP